MFDRVKEMAGQQAAGQMFDRFRPQLRALAEIVATRERRQLELAQRLARASDADIDVAELPDPEKRAAELEAMAEHASETDLEAWYFEEFAPDYLEAPEQAAQYAGISDEEYADQKEDWAAFYHDQYPEWAANKSVHEIVDAHTQETFGVSREEFEANVVNWRVGEAISRVLTTHLTQVEAVMEALAEHLEDANEGGA